MSGLKLYRLCCGSPQPATCEPKLKQSGTTLIELVVFIVIVSVSIAGVLIAIDRTARYSTDPLITKQALAIAESLLEEVELMPFTYCDPRDANVSTATSSAGCATIAEGLGPEAGETRYDVNTPFNNVNDYGAALGGPGFSMSSIKTITNTAVTGLEAYAASVTITPLADNTLPGIPDGEALKITVAVTGPAGVTVRLDGYRTRYAPNL